ncbi:hypothetical protein M514_04853 [Trichuris suis]|nr:hypothetical protein M514_04853 [Trichuris suis]
MDLIHRRYSSDDDIQKPSFNTLPVGNGSEAAIDCRRLPRVCVHHGQKRENKILQDGSGPDNIAGPYHIAFKWMSHGSHPWKVYW